MEALKSVGNALKTHWDGFSFEKNKHEIVAGLAVAIACIAILSMILTAHNKFPMTKCSSGVNNPVPNYILASVVTVVALFVLRLNYKSKVLGDTSKANEHHKAILSAVDVQKLKDLNLTSQDFERLKAQDKFNQTQVEYIQGFLKRYAKAVSDGIDTYTFNEEWRVFQNQLRGYQSVYK